MSLVDDYRVGDKKKETIWFTPVPRSNGRLVTGGGSLWEWDSDEDCYVWVEDL